MNRITEIFKGSLQKYGIVTFLSTMISTIIAYNTSDRSQSLVEMTAYNQYVTEILVLNKSPENRLKLAQYFSTVSPSWFTRNQWENYSKLVSIEKIEFEKRNLIINDSIATLIDKRVKSTKDSISLATLKQEQFKNSAIKSEVLKTTNENSEVFFEKSIYIQSSGSSLMQSEKLAFKLKEVGYTVAEIENMNNMKGTKINIEKSEIRYFNKENQANAENLYLVAKEYFADIKVNYNPRFSNSRNIEIWIK